MSSKVSPASQPTESPTAKIHTRPWAATLILTGGILLLALGMALSISFGAADIKLGVVWEAIFNFNPELTPHQIIWEIRLPRILGGAMVGACFAVAGAIMQGMTRNPLADSGLLGLNAGAGFALAVCFAFFPGMPYMYIILYSFVGAGLGVLLVYGFGAASKSGLTPLRLVLAGAAVSAMLSALSEGIALYFKIGQDLAFWTAGGVAGTKWSQLEVMFPWVLAALIAGIIISRSITLLSLGEDIAVGLGQRTGLIKLVGLIVVLILAGTAVSVVGAVGFVGLIIPHLTRKLVGVDYRWIIPCSAVMGSLLLVFADLAARMINPPYETPIGALVALIGVPFFLYLARKERRTL
ncbi:iron ABC transporter permease [Paenibacillus taichungensis]|uniref:Iron ABC transporter permease n=1 Tax=Paenibacillus taichungensis TaxID=484184 RepID=A0ABX2MT66_9BACL|nr:MULTISPECIES: iron ABC transporter permease [Paenibacillus]OME84751.1 ferrichrome ABC transporter permease [Paenibacillus pabuli]MDR9747080.1 iron ABC transporter permease [Paenibacillus taichungensis]MEC0108274.1 iron ABC transporter permease [Paenibacillus taichungensis]MEC0199681.1 iron ABC transporter permease [Paenibacillus taichungensis]NEU60635.1 iron ABC transporter permease [Paenibacillus sp. ALJ109b]